MVHMESACELYEGNCTCLDYSEGHSFNTLYFLSYGIIGTTTIVAGLLGNLLSTVVLCKNGMWSTHNYYLIALLAWDSVLLISAFLQFSFWVFYDENSNFKHYGAHVEFLSYVYVLLNTTMTGSIWILVCLTVQRYVGIAQPYYQIVSSQSGKRECKIAIVCSISAIVINIPRLFELGISTTCVAEQKRFKGELIEQTVEYAHASDISTSNGYFSLFRIGVDLILVYLVPLLTLSILTILMNISIQKATEARLQLTMSSTSSCSKTETIDKPKRKLSNNPNRTLIIVIIKFLICYSLPATLNLFELIVSTDWYLLSTVMERVSIVSNLLVMLNSACNFIIFYVNTRRFRNETRKTLSCCFKIPASLSPSPFQSESLAYHPANRIRKCHSQAEKFNIDQEKLPLRKTRSSIVHL